MIKKILVFPLWIVSDLACEDLEEYTIFGKTMLYLLGLAGLVATFPFTFLAAVLYAGFQILILICWLFLFLARKKEYRPNIKDFLLHK